jgi:hypothetical protein
MYANTYKKNFSDINQIINRSKIRLISVLFYQV